MNQRWMGIWIDVLGLLLTFVVAILTVIAYFILLQIVYWYVLSMLLVSVQFSAKVGRVLAGVSKEAPQAGS